MKKKSDMPRCIIIAGPNGAGKTTFAREFLPHEAGILHFVNADLIAAGLSPLKPELAAIAAGRLLLSELDRLAAARMDFAFESTLSGLTYAKQIREWKAAGYRIEMCFSPAGICTTGIAAHFGSCETGRTCCARSRRTKALSPGLVKFSDNISRTGGCVGCV